MAMPGDGSSGVEGYIVLYEVSTNRELARCYREDLEARMAFWTEGAVSFNGEDGFVWELPGK